MDHKFSEYSINSIEALTFLGLLVLGVKYTVFKRFFRCSWLVLKKTL